MHSKDISALNLKVFYVSNVTSTNLMMMGT